MWGGLVQELIVPEPHGRAQQAGSGAPRPGVELGGGPLEPVQLQHRLEHLVGGAGGLGGPGLRPVHRELVVSNAVGPSLEVVEDAVWDGVFDGEPAAVGEAARLFVADRRVGHQW